MVLQETSAYCEYCRRPVLGRRDGPNHLVHALVTLFLCGLWIPVWLIAAWSVGEYACPNCGGRVSNFPQQPGPARQFSHDEEAIVARRKRVNLGIAAAFALFLAALIALAVTAIVTKH